MKFKVLDSKRIFSEFFRVDRVRVLHECFNGRAPMEVVRYHLERPEVVAVILENAGHGGSEAAPVAGAWLHDYFVRAGVIEPEPEPAEGEQP